MGFTNPYHRFFREWWNSYTLRIYLQRFKIQTNPRQKFRGLSYLGRESKKNSYHRNDLGSMIRDISNFLNKS